MDSGVNEFYRYLGLIPLMITARFASWFDWHGIDGAVDGAATGMRNLGGFLRRMQSGQLQYTIFYAVTILALFLAAYVLA
ncbi:MAG: hypothetical protein COX17_02025 [Deltaproteobacteria bacterium CG23_combo_of_CG06-09_8_20_14_all_60_8]|nr:MAG: hypothetical protein COX17_02025 [Deltaproteobacteria bacterium CG23_combo_of_CG06-09_8_20_14_all_60_8]